MAKKKQNYTSFSNMLQYYLSLYYVMRERNKGIKQQPEKHKEKILPLEQEFQEELENKYPEWNTEVNKKALRKTIDFTTGVFSHDGKTEQKKTRLQELKESIIKKPIKI